MDKRTEYVDRLSAQMLEWDAQIDRLKFKATATRPRRGLNIPLHSQPCSSSGMRLR